MPLPAGYRHLVPSMQTGNADFDRRFLAYISSHLATWGTLSQAVAPNWHGGPTTDGQQTSFPNPSLPSMQFSQDIGQQQQQTASRLNAQRNTMGPPKYRHTPHTLAIRNPGTDYYPQGESPLFQGPEFTQQYFNSPCDSPLQPMPLDGRRMSLPAGLYTSPPSTSISASSTLRRRQPSESLATQDSNTTPDNRYHHHHHRNPGASRISPPSIGYAAQPADWQALTTPLSTQLPAGYQGLLTKDPWEALPEFASPWGQSISASSHRYSYSYNPNGRPKSTSHSATELTNGTGL